MNTVLRSSFAFALSIRDQLSRTLRICFVQTGDSSPG
jgi:hypothetical protein